MGEADRADVESDLAELTAKRRRRLWFIEPRHEAARIPIHRRVGVLDATAEETAWLVAAGEHGGPWFTSGPFDGPMTMSRWYEEHPDFPRDPSIARSA